MSGHTWLRIRLGFMALVFLAGLFVPAEQFEELRSRPNRTLATVGVFKVVSLSFIPLMLLLVIGIQAVNPFSDDKWTVPTHRSNPLRLGNPLLFFHFGAFIGGASGLGMLVSSLWNGLFVAAFGAVVVLGSIMSLVGVRLCSRVFKHKMMEGPPDQGDAGGRA